MSRKFKTPTDNWDKLYTSTSKNLDSGLSIYEFLKVPWLPELFAMAEDMKVLEGMLADGGLEASSDEVEAYKYTYRY